MDGATDGAGDGVVRVLVVEHDALCPPALLGDWLVEAGAELDVRRPYDGDVLPTELTGTDGDRAPDALLVLGGPMGAGDDDQHAWLEPTRALVRAAGAAGLPTLGVCLGHQLSALAHDGRVGRNPEGQQVGLVEVGWTPEAADDPLLGALAQGPTARGVHWNDDLVLQAPPDALPLAVTAAGEIQALRFAPSVWGVQWHPEVDDRILHHWAENDAERHLERGIDQEAVLAEVRAARGELVDTWRPLAVQLVRLAARARSGAGGVGPASS